MKMLDNALQSEITIESASTKNAQTSTMFKLLLSLKVKYTFLMTRLLASIEDSFHITLPRFSIHLPILVVFVLIPSLLFGPQAYASLRVQLIKKSPNAISIYEQAISKQTRSENARLANTFDTDTSMGNAPMIYPGVMTSDYNYHQSQTTSIHGPKIDECPTYVYYGDSKINGYVTTITSFYEGDNYYSKTTTFDLGGNLMDYYLTRPDYTLEYKGGDYAVQFNAPPMKILPEEEVAQIDAYVQPEYEAIPMDDIATSYPKEPHIDETPYVGQNQELITIEKIDGIEYYVYETKQPLYCETTDLYISFRNESNAQQYQQGIERYWINPSTYEILKTQTYLSTANPSNLITEIIYKNESKNVTLEEIANQFEFEYNVPIQVLPIEDHTKQLIEYLTRYPLKTILPINTEWTLSYAYSQKAQDLAYQASYTFDRAFYAPNAFGEHMYNNIIDTRTKYNDSYVGTPYAIALLDLQFANANNVTVTIQSHDATTPTASILDYYGARRDYSTPGSITIDSQVYTVQVYDLTASLDIYPREIEPSSSDEYSGIGSSYPSIGIDDTNYQYTSLLIVIERNEYIYTLRIDAYDQEEFRWQDSLSSFTETNTAINPQLTRLSDLIQDAS